MTKFEDLQIKARSLNLELTRTKPYTILNFGRAPLKSERYMVAPTVQPSGARDSAYVLFSSLKLVDEYLDTKCPDCGGDLVKRENGDMSDIQVWCGEWHDCFHCRFSRLSPSPELSMHLELQSAKACA